MAKKGKKKKASKAPKSKSIKGLSRKPFTLSDKDLSLIKGGGKGKKSSGGFRFIVPQ